MERALYAGGYGACLTSAGREIIFCGANLLTHGGGNSMAVSQELLDILVCPLDKTPVKLTSDLKGLKCPQCRRVYPIREDIPVMLVDEARIDPQ
jgi:uncharacterized protein YbaR (Trm112 family)